ncbi:MAG: MerR family transcriptional regulator [Bacillota bacterium]|nr:MerR family transcriptional regulator [Bacillota bacterium]
MKTVKEVSRLTGVSVRTLHYYHEIGLVNPKHTAANGYRYYGTQELERLQEVLFFRELDFSLKEIKNIMDTPGYDRQRALTNHISLLKMKKQRLTALINLAEQALEGEKNMEFKAFDDKEIKAAKEQYKAEARERWGQSPEYAESQEKEKNYTEAQWQAIHKEMDEIMTGFAQNSAADPGDPKLQELVRRWQEHLTKYYYKATNEILGCLGQMYVADERFAANIDKYGEGTAKILSQAIAIYVSGYSEQTR